MTYHSPFIIQNTCSQTKSGDTHNPPKKGLASLSQSGSVLLALLLHLTARHSRVEVSGPLLAETFKGIGARRRHPHAAVLVFAVPHLTPAHRLYAA